MALGGDFDEFEKRRMEALGYIWGGSGWLTVGIDNGNTMIVWPYKGNNDYTKTDGYGSGYVNVPNQPISLGSNVPGEKSLGQIQKEKIHFEKVASEAELKLSATRIQMTIILERMTSLSGVDFLRKQVELAVESIEEITLETELDGAQANAIHADLMMQGRLKAAGEPYYSEQQNSEKRQSRDILKNKIVIKQNEKQRRVAELNRLNAELELVNKGQDIRDVIYP